jgi:hypothetical protein
MSIRSTLEKLCRPDTHDDPKNFSDIELKAAVEKASQELEDRGWEVRRLGRRGDLTFTKTVKL